MVPQSGRFTFMLGSYSNIIMDINKIVKDRIIQKVSCGPLVRALYFVPALNYNNNQLICLGPALFHCP